MTGLTTIGFDADDTLWHNERFYQMTQRRFSELLADYSDGDRLAKRLLEAEQRNLDRYGFGIKGFMLSMIETALDVTEEKVPASVIRRIIDAGREMLEHPIELLPYARETVESLAGDYRILLITKGDLLDQERKLAQSGLGDLFDRVEIVSNKTAEVYAEIFERLADGAVRSMMVGNSLKSDVVPAIEAGCWGVHVPHDLAWALDHREPPIGHERFRVISHLGELSELVRVLG